MIDQKSNQADVYNALRIDVIFRLWFLGFYLRSFEWVFGYYIRLWSNRQWQNLHNGRRIRQIQPISLPIRLIRRPNPPLNKKHLVPYPP